MNRENHYKLIGGSAVGNCRLVFADCGKMQISGIKLTHKGFFTLSRGA